MCSSGSNGDAGSCVEAGQHSLSNQVSCAVCDECVHSLVKGVNDESECQYMKPLRHFMIWHSLGTS